MSLAKKSPTTRQNTNLNTAKQNKNDEFYTQISDIEKELKHYSSHFKDKVILCNCDDPNWSNFWIHFVQKFEVYGLKKVIATHYAKPEDNEGVSYKIELSGKNQGVIRTSLISNGDFRSEECIALLKEADIVITNPPFSLFREYVSQLIEFDKKFLIIGSDNAITYKEIFKLIKDNKIWLGNTKPKQFKQPDGSYKKFGNISWFTNLTHKKRNEELFLFKTYIGNEAEYPKYDNYNVIEVSKVANIPVDFEEAMGVPITFLEKFNPNQFEIVSANEYRISEKIAFKEHGLIKDKDGAINGKPTYVRIVIKKRLKNEN